MDDQDLATCPGCGGEITPRYRPMGVCQACYGTTDDPWLALREVERQAAGPGRDGMKLAEAALRLALSDQPGRGIAMHPDTKRALWAELERDGHMVPNEDPDAAEMIGGRYVATDAHLVEGAFVLVDP